MFADDTNLFFSHKKLNNLFVTVNNELKNIHEWFKVNKLSLNISKTKDEFFQANHKSDDITLHLT